MGGRTDPQRIAALSGRAGPGCPSDPSGLDLGGACAGGSRGCGRHRATLETLRRRLSSPLPPALCGPVRDATPEGAHIMSDRVVPYLRQPESIYAESREIIRKAIGTHQFSADEIEIVLRMIQASADMDYATSTVFTTGAVTAGIHALRAGLDLVLDVEMVKVGVEHDKLERWGGQIRCCIQDPDVQERALALGTTRASIGIEKAANRADGGVVAIGNAPTALFTVVELIMEGRLRPALVIGMPVGFVL